MSDRKNRKAFLASLGTGAAVLALRTKSEAQALPTAGNSSPAPIASPAAVASPSEKKEPSAAALATAVAMRRFDAALSDAEVRSIALDLDDARATGASLNPKKKRLRNSDEPVTAFSVTRR